MFIDSVTYYSGVGKGGTALGAMHRENTDPEVDLTAAMGAKAAASSFRSFRR